MNYMTGQGLAYLMALIVAVIAVSVMVLFIVGGNLNGVEIQGISKLMGQTLTRSGG